MPAMKSVLLTNVCMLAILVLGGCVPATLESTHMESSVEENLTEIPEKTTPISVVEIEQGQQIMPDTPDTPAERVQVKQEIMASDPESVDLNSGPLLVEFFAFWCPTCHQIAPEVHRVEAQYSAQISFVYLDVDDPGNEEFKRRLGYRVQPHIFLLDVNGSVVQEWVGIVNAGALSRAIDTLLEDNES